ncbi:putative 60S ribosome biogenesis protein Mak11 [Saccharata proteae CBS 121410]|uniref:60S ribosome biogenesis protein Mak11 n=1 Tax=Saccharata proteae CBS 121410 TaxID=1314787 RepID=A0A9P4HX40_9PEZI|nr:putative 60S ribosome biogenesis protein Mak11 [Saccharata proteae CBS 121410]
MAKRKRDVAAAEQPAAKKTAAAAPQPAKNATTTSPPISLQIVTGSYERSLHGIVATIPSSALASDDSDESSSVNFADSFLFSAHASAIRCLAISPPSESTDAGSQKVILASGSTDERINLYHLSIAPPPLNAHPSLPSLTGTPITQNPKNRELGSLMHHSSSVSALHFPSRGKLFSAADDNTIAVSRTRDWTVLSTIKAPIPKAHGRPSGDTAAPGEVPAGVNAFAVHPSQKLMISVGKGEKCMRLWNVMTGRKASVLNFERDMLQQVGEGKWSSGEGRKVEWNPEGDEWAVSFERGFIVYGMDSKPTTRAMPAPRTKLHQMHYIPDLGEDASDILAVSTEDGRILFYSTQEKEESKESKEGSIPTCPLVAQLGGKEAEITGRIKDFEIMNIPGAEKAEEFIIITASSDGAVRLWLLNRKELKAAASSRETAPKQIGRLIGTHETGSRITCLKTFALTGKPDEINEVEVEEEGGASSSSDDSDSE